MGIEPMTYALPRSAGHSTPTFYDVRVITVRLVAPFPAAVTTGIRSTIGQRR
jgi:hypothetical protein